tara:strand:+ start:2063 stop:2686 length:624 start_codon:yes stop_codon:yes gene_type:complete
LGKKLFYAIMEDVDVLSLINEIDGAIDAVPNHAEELVFDFLSTSNILEDGHSYKTSKHAKEVFASVASSMAEEVMEHMLFQYTHITSSCVLQAFDDLELPIIILSNNTMPIRISRLLKKYKSKLNKTWSISDNAKRMLSQSLYNAFNYLANIIHLTKAQTGHTKTMTAIDVLKVAEFAIDIRPHFARRHISRTHHAKSRVRKPNGQF